MEIATSAAATVVILGLGALTQLLDARIPLWTVLATAALLSGAVVALLRRRGRAGRRFFLVMPAFQQKDWFAKLLQDLLQVLERSGYDLVVKLPIRDFDAHSMVEVMRTLQRTRREYAGGFVIAAHPSRIEADIRAFCSKMDVPIAFLDVPPFPEGSEYPPSSTFLGYSAREIGYRAAECVAAQCKATRKRNPRILVIASQSQSDRQSAFMKRVKELLPGAHLDLTVDGDFSRSRAREAWLKYSVDATGAAKNVDVVFCTNDEMALGVVDALEESGRPPGTLPWLIGVDGTEEARAVIDRGGPMKASITQDSAQLASEALSHLNRLLDGERAGPRLMTPTVYERFQRRAPRSAH